MRAKTLAALVASVLAMLVSSRAAYADAKADVTNKVRTAMKAYDAFEYDKAKTLLGQAITMAKKAKLDTDSVLANAYLDLGIVQYAMEDVEAAKASFRSAIQIDPHIELELAYKSPDLAKLLDSVRLRVGDEPVISGGKTSSLSTTDCSSISGVSHKAIHLATAGKSQPFEVRVGPSIKKVSVMYRVDGATNFLEIPLKREGDCTYSGALPASSIHGKVLYYYIAAFADGPDPVATKGSAVLPNIAAISAASSAPGDDASLTATNGGHRSRKPTFLVAVAGGSGLGYVRGTTEGQNTVKSCCLGTNLFVATAELSYFAMPQVSIGGVFRLGVPVGANFDGHSTYAPAGLARLRYALSPTGEGLHVFAQAGFGFVRHAVRVDNPQPGMDTDVLAQGPVLIGGGMGATMNLTPSVALFADMTLLGAIAVVDRLGTSNVNSGIAGDLTLGVAAFL